MGKGLAVALGLACLVFTQAAFASISTGGSVKNLALASRSLVDGAGYGLNLTRLRLEAAGGWNDASLDLKYDLEMLTGSFLDTPDFALLRAAPDPRYWDLQSEIHESRSLVARQQLYRATLQWRTALGDIRFGRQQVNWATALIWNPMDVLNPVSPLQLEPDERTGVDAVLWDKSWGDLGRISAVHAPQHEASQQSTAVRAMRFLGGIDAGLMAGKFADNDKAGLGASGSLAYTGWRTEVVWTSPGQEASYWQAVGNLSWSHGSGLNLALEYFYNGHPIPHVSLGGSRVPGGEPIYAGQHYLGLLVFQDITPFWQYRVVVIRNADDASWVLYPRSTWTLPMRWEIYLTAGTQLYGGTPQSEYGRLEPLGLLEAQWFF